MITPTSTLSTVLRKYDGNYMLDNQIRVDWFSAYAVVSTQADNVAGHGIYLDLAEQWEKIEPAFREAFQSGMAIPELFFEIGQLWHITRDHAPADEVTYQRVCPYMLELRGDSWSSEEADGEAEG
jgi:hypothetical protein